MKPMPDRYRTQAPASQSLDALLKGLQPGQGVSVVFLPPYWDVLARIKADTTTAVEYIVTDSSLRDRKPQRVHGPVTTRAAALKWARNTQQIWLSTHVSFAVDDLSAP